MDVIVGEEVTCWLPDDRIEVHLAVYGMTEALHRELQPLRANVFDVAALLRERDVFFALNHLLHFYRGPSRWPGICVCCGWFRRSKCETARCWLRTMR